MAIEASPLSITCWLAAPPPQIERIEFFRRDAVGEQRRLPHAGAPFVHRPLARIFLDVEEVGHAFRRIGGELLGVVGDHVGEEIGRSRVVPIEAGPHLRLVDDRIIDRLHHALFAQRDRGERVGVDEIPGRLAALELRRDGAFGRTGSVLLDGDARRLEKRLAERLIVSL
jgi:hypothetical protein